MSNNVTTEIRENLRDLQKTLETNTKVTKLNFKRDYKLTQKSNINLWLDYLKSDLMENDLLDVIDESVQAPNDLGVEMITKRQEMVRHLIINHLDANYHNRILEIRDPKIILQKLKEFRKNESNVTHSSVRTRI